MDSILTGLPAFWRKKDPCHRHEGNEKDVGRQEQGNPAERERLPKRPGSGQQAEGEKARQGQPCHAKKDPSTEGTQHYCHEQGPIELSGAPDAGPIERSSRGGLATFLTQPCSETLARRTGDGDLLRVQPPYDRICLPSHRLDEKRVIARNMVRMIRESAHLVME